MIRSISPLKRARDDDLSSIDDRHHQRHRSEDGLVTNGQWRENGQTGTAHTTTQSQNSHSMRDESRNITFTEHNLQLVITPSTAPPHPPAAHSYYQAPAADYFQAPTVDNYFQAPAVDNYFQTPAVDSYFQAPAVDSYFQALDFSTGFLSPDTCYRSVGGVSSTSTEFFSGRAYPNLSNYSPSSSPGE